jgi:hypothetical protein
MTEIEEEISGSGFLESKFWRVFTILMAAVLTFTGPTYVPYVLWDALKINYLVSISLGLVVFIMGILLIVFLIRKKAIT